MIRIDGAVWLAACAAVACLGCPGTAQIGQGEQTVGATQVPWVPPDFCLPPDASELTAACAPGDDPNPAPAMPPACTIPDVVASIPEPARPEDGTVESERPGTGEGVPPAVPDTAARALDVVRADIRRVEAELERLDENDPSELDGKLELAGLYQEATDLLRQQWMEADVAVMDAEAAGESEGPAELRRRRDDLRAEANEWASKAIAVLAELARNWEGSPRYDEVLYLLAYALEERSRESEDFEQRADLGLQARTVYRELLQSRADSVFAPNAYLAFAEYAFEEGDIAQALEFYERVVAFPDSDVAGYALYKKAWCLYNLQEFERSLDGFQRVIEWAAAHPDRPNAEPLGREAEKDLVYAYAQVGRPDKAWRFFERVGGEPAAMVETLAELYETEGMFDQAVVVLHELMDKQRSSERLCGWETRAAGVRLAGVAFSGSARSDAVDALRRLVDVWRTFVKEEGDRHPTDVAERCTRETASMILDTATAWHGEAMGTPDAPGTRDPGTLLAAAELYGLYLDAFGDQQSPFYGDCLGLAEDAEPSPSVGTVRFFRAEAYWSAEDWSKCGPAYDDLFLADPAGPYAEEAVYAAVLCYAKQAGDGRVPSERLVLPGGGGPGASGSLPAPRELTDAERAMDAALRRYLCRAGPNDEDRANVAFLRAALYLDANRRQEAAALFGGIAEEHAGSSDVDDRRIAVLSTMSAFEILVRLERAGLDECTPVATAAAAASVARGFPSTADAALLETEAERNALAAYLAAVGSR